MNNRTTSLARRLRRTFARPEQPVASYMEVERAEQLFYLSYLRAGMTVFDVGANVGELTLLFSRFVGDGRVHAFEASSKVFERLSMLCRAAARPNIALHHLALAEMEGTVRLHIYDDDYLCWNSRALRPLENYGINVRPVATEDVTATTLDMFCETNRIPFIDLLKIDVEGAEFQVLLGARRMLQSKRIRCLTFEFGQTTFDMGNHPDDIERFLHDVGYKLRNVVTGDPVFPGRADVQSAQYSMHVATP